MLGLLGKKLGMTQINQGENRVSVTLIQTGPCIVVQKKTQARDGYTALQVGFGTKKAKRTPKANRVDFEKRKLSPMRTLKEFRVDQAVLDQFQIGQELQISDVFKEGQKIDIAGTTKGRGFAGVVKRWGMKGQSRTHGTHEHFRHVGSIGCRSFPGHVQKNKRMTGHYGVERVMIQNLKLERILADKNCILVSGSVPGANSGMLELLPSKRYPAK